MKQYADDHYYSSHSSNSAGAKANSTMAPPGPGEQGSSWGNPKDFPLPANKTVLVIGNSHTRQVSHAVLCQYADKVHGFDAAEAGSHAVTFQNGARWISITNRAIFYSRDWSQLLTHEMPSLDDPRNVDAIVLGRFNTFKESVNHTYALSMQSQQKELRDAFPYIEIDFQKIKGPDLLSVAKEFDEIPIVALTVFTKHFDYMMPKWEETIKSLNRTDIALLNGRAHIDALGKECGTNDKETVGTCHEMDEERPRGSPSPSNMHRCAGGNGGHADLIAWDVVNKLHEMLES